MKDKSRIIKVTKYGKIALYDEIICEIAGVTCAQCYGVVGMSAQSLHEGVATILGKDSLKKGVSVKWLEDESISVKLYVVLEAGVNISTVANNLESHLRYEIEKASHVKVSEVHIHVQGVRND